VSLFGEGYHEKYGKSHAEVNAINQVTNQELLKESTAFVTLEPCSHYGKTPPCADLLIEKGIKKVVIANEDPFMEVNGKGIEKLKRAGIEVEVGLMKDEAINLNRRFFTFHQRKRPYVILKWAQTADKYIARKNYDSKWISNEKSRQLVHKWRTEEDAILIGKNTALYDNPRLTARDWTGKSPIRILLDKKLQIDPTSNIYNDEAQTIILNEEEENQNNNLQWIKTSSFSPQAILTKLFELKIQSIIIEGGATILNSFINDNCWDEARVFTSPQTFKNGIEAPEIEGILQSEHTIDEDQLKIVKNQHG
jgi:diaminohydroxyphosphoribosylaminopyrimidine deaminase/5-amino-6-(5-phosphoribosylamino)uracil reductase